MDRGVWRATISMGSQRVGHDWATEHGTFLRENMFECSYPDTVFFKIFIYLFIDCVGSSLPPSIWDLTSSTRD